MSTFKNSFLKSVIKKTDNEFATIASEDTVEVKHIDTGSYALNALLSGSIYGGAADNKILAFAGEESTGKTFFTIACIKQFLEDNPEGQVFYFDSESAVEKETFESRGLDADRIGIFRVATIQEFRHQATNAIDMYKDVPEEERPPILFALDSYSMLSSDAEVNKVIEGNDTKDFTIHQVGKATFRVLTLKLGAYHIPMFLTAHVYANLGGYGETMKVGGGSGLKYAASQIITLTKAQFKEKSTDKLRSGSVITCTAKKSRFSREGAQVKVLLHHERGLDRYYGLLPIAEELGIISKQGKYYVMPDGSKHFESAINNDGAKFFTKEILDQIEAKVGTLFAYGDKGTDEAPGDE